MSLLLAFIALAGAHAGTVVVETAVATEVRLEHQPVVKTFGPAEVQLPDVPAGRTRLTRAAHVERSGPRTVVPPSTTRT